MTEASASRWLFVFSHPNHEIAVHGHLQRLRPWMVFLTDGGGPQRLADTRAGLGRLDLLDQASFLDRPEAALYRALARHDMAFLRALAADLATVIRRVQPDAVAADAVEFYNPVHDIALPLTRAALDLAGSAAPLHEVPLIFRRGDSEAYGVQTAQAPDARQIMLDDGEWALKWQSWTGIYHGLRAQLGHIVAALPRSALAVETLQPARDPLRRPESHERLHYEWRGRELARSGAVAEAITLQGHVLPMARALLGQQG